MANRGSHTYKHNDPIYGIEVTHADGHTAFKTFPSLAGLKAGLKAVDADIVHWARWASQGWVPMRREVFITKPRWHYFDPENP